MAAVVIASLAACGNDSSSVSVRLHTTPALDWSGLTVELHGPGARRTYRPRDFTPVSGSASQFTGGALFLRGSGTLYIATGLTEPGGNRGVQSISNVPVEPNFTYGVSVFLGGARPAGFFCGRVVDAVAVPWSRGDSVFVVHGNVPNDAVC